jgi:hypothetical protein
MNGWKYIWEAHRKRDGRRSATGGDEAQMSTMAGLQQSLDVAK